MSIRRSYIGPRLSDMVIHGDTIYLAGQVADDTAADIGSQTSEVLSAIDKLLGEAGSDKSKILSVTIYIADMADFAGMNAVWEKWVPAGHTPARATVEAKMAKPAYKVEMQVIAAK